MAGVLRAVHGGGNPGCVGAGAAEQVRRPVPATGFSAVWLHRRGCRLLRRTAVPVRRRTPAERRPIPAAVGVRPLPGSARDRVRRGRVRVEPAHRPASPVDGPPGPGPRGRHRRRPVRDDARPPPSGRRRPGGRHQRRPRSGPRRGARPERGARRHRRCLGPGCAACRGCAPSGHRVRLPAGQRSHRRDGGCRGRARRAGTRPGRATRLLCAAGRR